ncbi:MAG TPA: L,D-transpeptidase [Candidatus Angelobacter sp.]|nr:L,D-transpeptidase [Candidatus Angelobacter sp.]
MTSASVLADVKHVLNIQRPAFTSASTSGQDAKIANQNPSIKNAAVENNEEAAAEQQLSEKTSETDQNNAGDRVRQIVISIPDRQLALLEDGVVVKVYPIAVGKPGTPSPEGDFTIINRSENPTWRHKGQTVLPGKNNPVGTRWMGLSLKGYGIHGTNVQSSVGKAASHGCFRMKKNDIEELFTLVRVGDVVTIHGQRDELTARLFNSDPAANNGETEIASAVAVTNTVDR